MKAAAGICRSPERAARGSGQFIQRVAGFWAAACRKFSSVATVARQRLVAETLGFQRARLDSVFQLPVMLADFVHHPLADGGVGLVDPRLPVVKCVCR